MSLEVPVFNFTIVQGEEMVLPVSITKDGSALDLSDFSGWAVEVRDKPGGTLFGLGTFTVTTATTGQGDLTLPQAVTAAVTTDTAVYDVWYLDAAGKKKKAFRGNKCPVEKRVTQTVPPA